MGASYYAKTIIGIKIDPEKLYVEEEETSEYCKCKGNDPSTMKFCPECGNCNKIITTAVTKKYHPILNLHQDRSLDCHKITYKDTEFVFFQNEALYLTIYQESISQHDIGRYEFYEISICEYELEELVQKRDLMKEFLTQNNFCSAEHFDKYFGIHTIIERN